ncbi:BTAD domain-containing putative transcriptional regulator [Streptosporangium soli]|nr:winged helix-turn-helix domain-containing protein [Streptosporangium sp. KLBMP 9127]
MEVRLLGGVEISRNGMSTGLPSSRVRGVLAILALEAGQYVSRTRISDLLWDDAPASASSNLSTYVALLRRYLRRVGADGLVGTLQGGGGGYSLSIESARVDVHSFSRLVEGGRAALYRGDLSAAERSIAQAVSLWRGPAGLDTSASEALRSRLEDFSRLYMDLRVDRSEVMLLAGDLLESLREALAVVAEDPLRERAWGLVVRAYYLLGQDGAADNAYRKAVHALRSELGVDPSAGLRRIHAAMLTRNDEVLRRLNLRS